MSRPTESPKKAAASNSNQAASTSSAVAIWPIGTPVLPEAIESLFRKGNFADFTFLFNEADGQKRIPAHKLILKATSDVFATMLNGDWKEENEVEIEDASFAAFKEFLQFLYLLKAKISSENICEVVYLASKYNVRKCKELCAQRIKDEITSDNVCTGLDLALQHDLGELKERCLDKISCDANETFETDGFLDCSKESLKTILAMADISCDEINIFEACLKWAKHACGLKKKNPSVMANVRKELGDCLYQIRFGAMTPKQIADCVAENDGLFKPSEEKDLWLAIGSNNSRVKIFKNTAARGERWNNVKALECNLQSTSYYNSTYIGNSESTTFQVSKSLLFGAISVFSIGDVPNNITAKISVFKIAVNRQQTKVLQKDVQHDGSIYIQFKKPIRLQANTEYEVRIEAGIGEYYYGRSIGPNKRKNFGDGIVLNTNSKCSNFIKSLHFNQ